MSNNHSLKPSLVGNLMEVYDMSIYGYLAPFIALNFFPHDNPTTAMIQTFTVFFIGFLARPLGAILFGHIGDAYGRKNALIVSIILIALATTLMGILPTHHSVGAWAAYFLIVCRVFQGFSVGGEYLGSNIYYVEHVADKKRGFSSGLIQNSGIAGTLTAAFTCWLVTLLASHSQITAYAWRIPFLIAIVGGGVGLYIRWRAQEPKIFTEQRAQMPDNYKPFIETMKHQKRNLLLILGLIWLGLVSSYLGVVYMTTYMKVVLHYSLHTALTINTLSVISLLFWMPFAGYLSDKFGRKRIMALGAIGMFVFVVPYYALLGTHNFTIALLAQLAFLAPLALYNSVAVTVIIEMIPTHVRFSTTNIGYNLGAAIFGGSTPLIASWLVHLTHDQYAPAYYLMAVCVLTMGVLFFVVETSKTSLASH